MSEKELIAKAKRKNKKAMEELYTKNFKSLYIFVRHKVNTNEDAEDIVAEAFTKAFKNIEGFKEGSSFKTWLYTIAKNCNYDYYRVKDKAVGEYDFENVQEKESSKNENQSELEKEVKNILKKLKDNYKQVLELRFLLNCSIKETAEIMDTSEGNVKVLQNRAIKKARNLMSD